MTGITRLGRGAWPSDGRGGTLAADGTKPGKYYRTGVGTQPNTGEDLDMLAVTRAVIAITHLLNRARYTYEGQPLPESGYFGIELATAMTLYQKRVGLVADGIFGPKTSQRFFLPTVQAAYRQHGLDWKIGFGLVTVESMWDPGAVGYIDNHDLGLCQINGPAHPSMTIWERLDPESSLMWQADYIANLTSALGNPTDAVAAYNLGLGGVRMWIRDGRPDVWIPPFDSSGRERDVAAYVDKVMGAAGLAGVS